MKLKYLFPILTALVGLTACEDTIDQRFSPSAPLPPVRTVLVEEYTGTRCVNCPNGHKILDALEEYYNTEDNLEHNIGVIVVGIHIPQFGYTVARGGFITPEAADLTPEGVNPPQAQINRNGNILDRADWGKELAIELARTPEVTFPDRVTATVNANGIKVSGVVTAGDNIGDARLHVWLVEDNIVFRQDMPDGSHQDDYVHQNVYRAHMTDSYAGMDFALTRNVERAFSLTYPVHEKWNVANLRAVVFVEAPSRGVLNATQAPVVSL